MGTDSVDTLTRRMADFERERDLSTIESLTTENCLLQKLIEAHRKKWAQTIDLLEQTHQTLLVLQAAYQKYVNDAVAGERASLASWDCPGGWI